MNHETSPFDNDVHFLFSTRYVRNNIPSTKPKLSMEQHRRVQLLNDITLLLITEAKNDACAVTMKLTHQRIEFFYAKTPPCRHPSLESYICQIKQIIAAPTSSNSMEEQLLTLILRTCVDKVRSIFQKIQRALANHPQLCTPSHLPSALDSRQLCKFRKKWQNMNDAQIIAEVLTNIREADLKMKKLKANIPTLLMFTRAAFLIGNVTYLIL